MYIRETHPMQWYWLDSFVCSDAQRISLEVIKTEGTNSLIDRCEKNEPLDISRSENIRKFLLIFHNTVIYSD